MKLKTLLRSAKAANQTLLHLKFSAGKDFDVELIERPALCLNEGEKNSLLEELRATARESNRGFNLEYGILEGTQEALENTIVTAVRSKSQNNKIVAFNAMRYVQLEALNETLIHMGLVLVAPGTRGSGLSWLLYSFPIFTLLIRNGFRPLLMSNVTQVPSVVGMVSDSLSRVFPVPENALYPSPEHLLIGWELMEKHRHIFGVGAEAEFDANTFVIKNAYTGGSDNLKKTFQEAVKHRKEIYNSFCEKNLNYTRGDDFLQIGWFDFSALFGFMAKEAPKNIVLKLIFNGIESWTTKRIIPFAQWLKGTGELL